MSATGHLYVISYPVPFARTNNRRCAGLTALEQNAADALVTRLDDTIWLAASGSRRPEGQRPPRRMADRHPREQHHRKDERCLQRPIRPPRRGRPVRLLRQRRRAVQRQGAHPVHSRLHHQRRQPGSWEHRRRRAARQQLPPQRHGLLVHGAPTGRSCPTRLPDAAASNERTVSRSAGAVANRRQRRSAHALHVARRRLQLPGLGLLLRPLLHRRCGGPSPALRPLRWNRRPGLAPAWHSGPHTAVR